MASSSSNCVTAERMSPYPPHGPQNNRSPSLALSLRNLNNHRALQNAPGVGLGLQTIGQGSRGTPSQSSLSDINNLDNTAPLRNGLHDTRGKQANLDLRPLTPEPSGNGLNAEHDNDVPDTTQQLTSEEQEFLQALCIKAGLDISHEEYAQSQSEVVGDRHRHMAVSTAHAQLLMEITNVSMVVNTLAETVRGLAEEIRTRPLVAASAAGPPASAQAPPATATAAASSVAIGPGPWVASTTLLDALNQLADKKITLSILESYTALKGTNQLWLTHSLFNTVKLTLGNKNPAWKAEHLPRKIAGITDSRGVKRYHSDIKNACKHAREKMHNSLLSGIYDPKVLDTNPVPDMKELVYIIGKGSESIWAAVDTQLEKLCLEEKCRTNNANDNGYKSGDYTSANGYRFHKIIYDQDRQYFTGQTYFKDLTKVYIFALPSEEQIEAGLQAAISEQANNDQADEQGGSAGTVPMEM
ncbi:hypothetical protein DFH28DRAFT_1084900 [Melampsora americana]|nr:hypothetical protein DFH28DRAFT_1084900 [Melampsora americana]